MKKLRRAFITGFLIAVPVLATIDILRWAVNFVDRSVNEYLPTGAVPLDFPGRGVLLVTVVVVVLGILTQNFIGNWVVRQFDNFVGRFPLIGGLYGGIKKFLETVLNPTNDKFSEAVLVEFPKEGVYSIGFRTGEPDPKVVNGKKGLVNVFIPLVPNPTAGFYFLIPERDVTKLDMTVQEAFKIAISMGVMTSKDELEYPKKKKKKKKR